MYSTAAGVWRGLRKNATEGLGAPGRILPFTLMLTLGQVAPLVLVFATQGQARMMSAAALALSYLPRLLGMRRFEQPMLGVVLHPLGVLLLLAIQWQALAMKLTGVAAEWKGRSYASRQSR